MRNGLLEEQRESWGTRGGFVLAAVGSAVGLGNLWGFPYKLYSYGGGAFLIPYILALVVVGIPVMVLEFSIGHYTQRAAPDAFKRGHKRFELVGWWGIVLAFVIVIYYPVILAYCFSFLWYSIVGILNGGELPWAGTGIEGVENAKEFFNDTYLGKIDIEEARFYLGSIRSNIVLPLVITWVAMYFCIFKGVRLVGKIVWLTVPLPWLMLLILAVRGLTLEGSMQGLAFYLDPVWSELAKPITWRYAFGQVFFSLSLAYGIMITYASFLHRKSDLNNNAAVISIADFATSFVAGLAVFATLGGMAFVTQQDGFLFSVDMKAKNNLENRVIFEEVRQEFGKYDTQLSQEATISVEGGENRWVLTDKDNRYLIGLEQGKLNVYQADKLVKVENVAETGPSLAFVAFPYALAQLPYSAWFSFIFFFALVTLGLDSAFSMTESILASIVDKTGWRRSIVLPLLTLVGFTFGLLFVTKAGFNWLGTIDGFVNGTWGIAFMGLLECIVLGWLWRVSTLRRHANSRSDWRLGRWWDYLIRLVIPILLGTLFFWQFFDDISGGYLFKIKPEYQSVLSKGVISEELRKEFEDNGSLISEEATFSVEQADLSWLITDGEEKEYLIRKEEGRLNIYDNKGGFLRTPSGAWKLPNCVGLFIVALVPVLAVILSLVKVREDIKSPSHEEADFAIKGSRGGVLAFLLALIPAAGLLVILLGSTIPEAAVNELGNPVFWFLLGISIVAMGLSNYLLDKHNTSSSQVSWFARWAGILATMDVSAFVAVILLGLKGGAKIGEETMPIRDKLSGVSYIILAAVFLIIVGGLVWCFFRALVVANADTGIQHPDEVGDEKPEVRRNVSE